MISIFKVQKGTIISVRKLGGPQPSEEGLSRQAHSLLLCPFFTTAEENQLKSSLEQAVV